MRLKSVLPRLLMAASIPWISTEINAVDFHGLTQSGNRLLRFNESGAVLNNVAITGLQGGDSLVDIDVFSSGDLRLYGLGTSGTLYTINPDSGAATVNVLNAAVGSPTAIDFNPAADRLRVLSGDSNYRVTPGTGVVSSDGSLAFAAGDANAGADPTLVAAAYINNVDAPASTALYSIDAGLNVLILHSGAPQFSTLNTVASLSLLGASFDVGTSAGFDVFSTGVGNNSAFLSNGNDLYSLNLSNGQLGFLGTVLTTDAIRSIAVAGVPEGGSLLPGLFAALAGLRHFGKRFARA